MRIVRTRELAAFSCTVPVARMRVGSGVAMAAGVAGIAVGDATVGRAVGVAVALHATQHITAIARISAPPGPR